MKMIARDQEYFTKKFGAAMDFISDAELRMKCCVLATKDRDKFENRRLGELLHTPACSEKWFRNQIASNMSIPPGELDALAADLAPPEIGEFIHIFNGDIDGCVYAIEKLKDGPIGSIRVTLETEPDQPCEDMKTYSVLHDQYCIV